MDHQQRLICGPCAGDDRNWICRRCGRFAALFSDGNCPHCVARDRLHRLLAGPDGHPHPQLTTLRKLLEAELDTDPFIIILLIHNTDWARLLGQLADQHREITHAVLDDQPPRRHVHYLRTILVNAGILPDRDEHIESTPVWLDALLSGLPADTVQIIRPYATWFVLRRARARARHRPATRSVRKYIRARIVGALAFLAWLDQRGLTLGAVTQADVEVWLEGGGNNRYRLREFLAWAAARGLTHSKLDVRWLGRGELRDVLDEDQRWELLQRCLTDESLDLPIRAAGALTLLFGMVPTKITALTASDLSTNDGRTYLTIDAQPVLLPPRLGALLTDLASSTPTGRRPRVELPTGPRLLFPGTHPGRPVDPDRLSSTLNQQLGLRIRPARNAALCALAADLPAPVLADLLGLHINTAVRWVHLVRRDWTDYLAARKALTTQNVRPDPYPPNSR